MIELSRKEDCVGCNACVQRCPKQCISMNEDEQGFLYPKIDVSKCIDCGLCEKVCPVISQYEPKKPDKVYAGWNVNDRIRLNSSSGGIFHALAKMTIDKQGVVFGARFNDKWEVVHASTESMEGVRAFQSSKYVQSRIGQSYLEAEGFLKSGRKVLFSGTPCQIAGLKRFLRKDYDSLLLTVDVVCHGVPSPGIWKDYLNFIKCPKGALKNTESQPHHKSMDDMSSIEDISFRDKRFGWEKFGIAIHYAAPEGGRNSESQSAISTKNKISELFESNRVNLFMQGFLKDLYLRPSCYECPTKCGKSHADITMADFWGIKNHHPELYSEKGVSLILANSKYGNFVLDTINIERYEVSYSEATVGNPAIIRSATKPQQYSFFWQTYKINGLSALNYVLKEMKPTVYQRVIYLKNRVLRKLKKLIR